MKAIPTERNLAITAFVGAWHLALLFALPLLVRHSLWWALPFAAMLWLNVTHWALIHEAIHGLLHPDKARNDRMGRGLSVLFGASFHMLKFGHLMHHKLNRDWHAEDASDRSLRGRIHYYYTLILGLYVSEISTSIAMAVLPEDRFMKLAEATVIKGMPDVSVAGRRFFYRRGNAMFLRRDMASSFILYAASLMLYGVHWPVLLGFIAARGFVISFFDNLYHFGTPADNSKTAKELALPAPVSAMLLHGNYHETHHLNPDVPWVALPRMHEAQARGFDGGLVPHGLMQFAR